MYRKLGILFFIVSLMLACDLDRVVQIVPKNQTELPAAANAGQPVAVQPAAPEQAQLAPTATPEPTFTPIPTATPLPTNTPTPSPFLYSLSTTPSPRIQEVETNRGIDLALPRHGILIAFVLPLLLFGVPGAVIEIFVARYVQPRSVDLSGVLIKAQDGLFINAVVSMTARKTVSLASLTNRWGRVRDVVEKAIEQELIHEALNYPSLPELENNLKEIVERFTQMTIIDELTRDFGVRVLRFNIEIRYPAETIDAINRKAEASAGGQAYVAYARAARLNPDAGETRELYNVFQQTTSQVDAARNLGSGISGLANLLGQNINKRPREDVDDDSEE